jgi:hypothetical protein
MMPMKGNLHMRFIAAVAFSSAVLLSPVLAAAQETASPASPGVPPAAAATDSSGANLDEIVCKTTPPPTGSRLGGGRECRTQREWNQREVDAQTALRHQQDQGFKKGGG